MGKIWFFKDTHFLEHLELEILEPVGVALQLLGTSLIFIALMGAAAYGVYRLWMVRDNIYKNSDLIVLVFVLIAYLTSRYQLGICFLLHKLCLNLYLAKLYLFPVTWDRVYLVWVAGRSLSVVTWTTLLIYVPDWKPD